MALTNTTCEVRYTGTGATATYAIPFRFDAKSDLAVSTYTSASPGVKTDLVLTTDYTIPDTDVGLSAGGSLTLVAGNLASGTILVVRRVKPLTQTTDIANQGAYYAKTHEDRFDAITEQIQELSARIDRSFKLTPQEAGTAALTELAGPASYRANKVLHCDASGNIAVSSGAALGVGGFTSGSIPYANSSGLLTENNPSLWWDSANSTLNIGVTHAFPAGTKYLKFPNLDPNFSTTYWGITQAWYDNTNGSRDDSMLFVGYNWSTTAGKQNTAEPAWGLQLETYENDTDPGIPYVEGHLTYIGVGTVSTVRPLSCRVRLSDHKAFTSLTGDLILFKDSTNATLGLSASITTTTWAFGIGVTANANSIFHIKNRSGVNPILLESSSAAADNKYWDIAMAGSGSADFTLRAVNDAYGAAGVALQVGRSGATVGSMGLRTAPNTNVNIHAKGTFLWESATGSANNKFWDISYGAGDAFTLRAVNDAYGAAGNVFSVVRSGATVSTVTFGAPVIGIDGLVGSPSFAFTSEPTTGYYRAAAATIALAIAGTQRHQYTANTYSILHDSALILLGASSDARIARDAANVIAFVNSNTAQTVRVYAGNGSNLGIVTVNESLPIAAAATTDSTTTIPAGAVILSVATRVTTVIPTAATFTVTAATGGAAFNTAAISTAATSTDAGTAAGHLYTSAGTKVRITPNLTPGTATGVVRLAMTYMLTTPPTS